MAKVTLFLDFLEDRRWSMERYAAELAPALAQAAPAGWTIESYRPHYRRIPGLSSRWNDRISRYAGYPLQAIRHTGQISHIIDHAYAHLMLGLDASKSIVTVHDLIPLLAHRGRIPGWQGGRPWLSEVSAGFLKSAALLTADSANTKRDLIEILKIDPGRIYVIHPGVSSGFQPPVERKDELRASLGLPADGDLVLVTGKQFYKNHVTSVRILKELRDRGRLALRLLSLGELPQDILAIATALGVREYIVDVRAQTTTDLTKIYGAADCLLFPSLYEGFGWPPLEAMACGTPVVCSNAGSLPEVVGKAALTYGPDDVNGFADGIELILSDDHKRSELVRQGLLRAGQFDWQKCAAAVLGLYRTLA